MINAFVALEDKTFLVPPRSSTDENGVGAVSLALTGPGHKWNKYCNAAASIMYTTKD